MSDDDDIAPTELDDYSEASAEHATDTLVDEDTVPGVLVHATDTILEDDTAPGDDTVLILDDDADQYGFISRAQEQDARHDESKRSRSRSRRRQAEKRAQEQHIQVAASSSGNQITQVATSSSNSTGTLDTAQFTMTFANLEQQTVFYNCLPRNLDIQCNHHPTRALYYQFMFSEMPKLKRIAMHLDEKYPSRHWYPYLLEVAQFGTFCNTKKELLHCMFNCNSSYKWGATADLIRRWYDLGTHKMFKSYKHLYFVITGSVAESASMETSLIAYSKSEYVSKPVRDRCENNTHGGEGLGQDKERLASSQGHFVYLAIAKNR
jgi:hypothetical protein